MVYPDSVISTGGEFGGEREHRGVDHSQSKIVAAGLSTDFTPWAEGTIVDIRRADEGIYGFFIEIEDVEGMFWSYCHAKSINDDLREGGRVTFDTRLGRMGSTGSVVDAGAEHLHSMCSTTQGAARSGAIAVFDPIPHISARLTIAAASLRVLEDEREEDMFQFKKKSGTKYFVHPNLPVAKIEDFEWAIYRKVGIRSEVDVDNDTARSFIKLHDARAKQLSPLVFSAVENVVVEGVLEGFDLPEDIAGEVSDAVYLEVGGRGGAVDADTALELANAALAGANSRRAAPPVE